MKITALSRRHHAECRQMAFEVMEEQPHLGASELEAEVGRRMGERSPTDWPSERTWDSFVAQWRLHATEPWDLETAPSSEVAPVLRAHASSILDPRMSGRWPSRAEAAWIARITGAVPDIPPALAYRYATRAARDPSEHRAIADVLALAPWRDDGKVLVDAVVAGSVPFDRAYLAGYRQRYEYETDAFRLGMERAREGRKGGTR